LWTNGKSLRLKLQLYPPVAGFPDLRLPRDFNVAHEMSILKSTLPSVDNHSAA